MQNSDKLKSLIQHICNTKGKPYWFLPFFLGIFISFHHSALAQKHDLGFGIGAANYTGDLVKTYSLRTHRPGGWLFYRYNVNEAVSIRASLSGGWVTGSDQPAFDAFAEQRNKPSFNILLSEFGATFEYNFLKYKDPKTHLRWSPYFFGGFAMFMVSGYDPNERATDFHRFQPSIPVGIGAKYRLSPTLTLGFEWGARKTFFDYIDNTGAFPREETGGAKDYQYGNVHHKDWYYFTGFTLSYTIWTIPCPYTFE